jgi:metallo-beta-lactamase class B
LGGAYYEPMTVRATALLLLSTLSFFWQAAPTRIQPDPPITCDSCDEWNQSREPFKVFGNTYYVGVAGLSAVLITSDAGLILVDGALPQSVPLIDAGIRKLGFKTEDITLILNGHTHYDHAGGLNALERFTGARVATGTAGVRALEQGKPTRDDPQVGFEGNGFPPVRNVVGVADGEVLRVGDLAVTAHATPGHTPGGTTWSWRSCEGARCLDVVYADSLSAVAAPGYRFTGDATHPSIVASFRRSITRVSQLPCDIMIGAHPFVGDLDGKLKRRAAEPGGTNPFIDAGACRTLAAEAMKGLDERVAEETGKKKD